MQPRVAILAQQEGKLFTPFFIWSPRRFMRRLKTCLGNRIKFRQTSFFRVPRRSRPLRPIKNLPIRRKLQNRHVAQPVCPQPLRDQLRRRMKSLRPALPVEPRDSFEIPFGSLPAQLIRQRRHIFFLQERRFLGGNLPAQEQHPNQSKAQFLHAISLRAAFYSVLLFRRCFPSSRPSQPASNFPEISAPGPSYYEWPRSEERRVGKECRSRWS